jgi:putative phosphoribosyl transferase
VTAAFRNRDAAGTRLAEMLGRYRGSDTLVLAIPAGGVPVAVQIARTLSLPLQIAPVSKVLFPWTTESGFGAVAFDGSVWIDQAAAENYGLKEEQIAKAIADARAKVERRCARFCRSEVDPGRKTVILVDDGIAAGSTMRTAIAALRRLGAKTIVVAVPTAHERSLAELRRLAEEIVCADIRGGTRFAVADAYEEWRDLSDDEIEAMLKPGNTK